MRILVGTGEPIGSSGNSYWRQIVPLSRIKGHQVLFTDAAPRKLFASADIVCLQREGGIALMKGLLEIGKPVLVDFDDNLHSMHADNGARQVYSNGKKSTTLFEEVLALATVVTTSTQRLADEYARFRTGIRVCPNFMPDDIFERLRPQSITGKQKSKNEIRVGYVGGRTHLSDLRSVIKPLTKLCRKYPQVRLVFFGQMPPDELDLEEQTEYHGIILEEPGETLYQSMDRYFAKLQSLDLDIAIAPIIPSAFNAGKSYLKALEYGACGFPVVASSFGPYREYVAMGGRIDLAFDDKEWFRHLSRLVEDPSARRDLAESNATFVRESCGTSTGLAPWLQAIDAALLAVA